MSLDLSKILSPYDPDESCPKCGHEHVLTIYRSDSSHCTCVVAARLGTGRAGEHLERRCGRCAYQWEQTCVEAATTTT